MRTAADRHRAPAIDSDRSKRSPVPLKSPSEPKIPIALRNTRSCVGVMSLMRPDITVKKRGGAKNDLIYALISKIYGKRGRGERAKFFRSCYALQDELPQDIVPRPFTGIAQHLTSLRTPSPQLAHEFRRDARARGEPRYSKLSGTPRITMSLLPRKSP